VLAAAGADDEDPCRAHLHDRRSTGSPGDV
jgi:hypothetical protein